MWYGVWSQVCMMLMLGTLLSLFFQCLVINTSGSIFWINPIWRDAGSFEQSDVYGQMIHYDLRQLARFIAASSQLETNGSFDENKNVDILQYVYRESGKVPERFGNLKLVYQIGDLIEWEQEGFLYESVLVEDVIEEAIPGQQAAMEQYEYEVLGEDVYGAETVSEQRDSEQREKTQLVESFLPVNGVSIFDLELPEGVTCDELAGYVQSAARDLSYNYEFYQNYVSRYKGNRNLKYMMLDNKGKVRFTNLDTKGKEVSKLIGEFEKSDSYVIYDYTDNTIERHNGGDYDTDISAKSLFHAYSYLYPDGGTLCIALQTGDSPVFGSYSYDDCYARARMSYQEIAGYGSMNLIAALVFGILSVAFWILFTVRQPRRQPQELKGFDRWYTGIAAASAVGVETGLSVFIIWFSDLWFSELWKNNLDVRMITGAGGSLNKEQYMSFLLCAVGILYLLFLLFWGSLVRRIKARTLWRGSLTCHILLWCRAAMRKIKAFLLRFAGGFLNSKDFALRVALPYIGVLFISVLVILATDGGPGGFFMALLLHALILVCLYQCDRARKGVLDGIDRICDGDLEYQIDTSKLIGRDKTLAENVNRIGQAIEEAVKANMKNERLKADLITNVSHDIKTPLTSIINYVDLLKRENIQGEKAQEYIRVLDEKSQRLKQLTLDLVEASKISSGNIVIEKTRLDVGELLQQAAGEYETQLADRELSLVLSPGEEKGGVCISADPRHMWRVMDNLLGNVCKYALRGTRVYIDIVYKDAQQVQIVMKNISAQPLNIPVEELTLRFVRGDEARSTEGSGLGLSIAQNLTTAQGGEFEICLDGDLFKVIMTFPALAADIS